MSAKKSQPKAVSVAAELAPSLPPPSSSTGTAEEPVGKTLSIADRIEKISTCAAKTRSLRPAFNSAEREKFEVHSATWRKWIEVKNRTSAEGVRKAKAQAVAEDFADPERIEAGIKRFSNETEADVVARRSIGIGLNRASGQALDIIRPALERAVAEIDDVIREAVELEFTTADFLISTAPIRAPIARLRSFYTSALGSIVSADGRTLYPSHIDVVPGDAPDLRAGPLVWTEEKWAAQLAPVTVAEEKVVQPYQAPATFKGVAPSASGSRQTVSEFDTVFPTPSADSHNTDLVA